MLSCQVNNAETPNLVWVLLRLFSQNIIELPISSQLVTDQQIIPFWTGYFRVTSKSSSSFSKVAYPPIVDAKPTDMTTLSCFIACIGKLWSDGSLSDFLVESGIYASCTVELNMLLCSYSSIESSNVFVVVNMF
jgi:hypothetical protein